MNNKNKEFEIEKINNAFFYIKRKEFNKAEDILKDLIKKKTTNFEVYANLARILGLQNKKKEMIKAYEQAIKLNYNFPEAYSNIGNTFFEKKEYKKAIYYYRQAVKLNPNQAEPFYNYGNALMEVEDFKKAISCYEKAIKINSKFYLAYNNLANVYANQGNLIKSIEYFKRTLIINNKHHSARHNLGMIQLLCGDYKEGLVNFEFRHNALTGNLPHAKPNIKRWNGEQIKKGEKLLVISEQGLGDTIQFMRFIPKLRQENINVIFSAQKKLHNLIQFSGIDLNPLNKDEANKISEGKWIPLLSLLKYFKVNTKNQIYNGPYLKINNQQFIKWRTIFSKEKKPVIGLNWQGNPLAEVSLLKGRSIHLEMFSKIIDNNKSIKLVSLQKGFGSEQLNKCTFLEKFVNFQDEVSRIWDFQETTAIIKNCDLVITTDTLVAHLAGALGKETWLLLKYIPDWRWGLDGEKTFWYPSLRLFRQNEKKSWKEVIERLSLELNKKFCKNFDY